MDRAGEELCLRVAKAQVELNGGNAWPGGLASAGEGVVLDSACYKKGGWRVLRQEVPTARITPGVPAAWVGGVIWWVLTLPELREPPFDAGFGYINASYYLWAPSRSLYQKHWKLQKRVYYYYHGYLACVFFSPTSETCQCLPYC